MSFKYDEYLDKGTSTLLELISSADINDEEKVLLVDIFSAELEKNIGNSEVSGNPEQLIYSTAVRTVDDTISKYLADSGLTYAECSSAIKLCERLEIMLNKITQSGLKQPEIVNGNLDKCKNSFLSRRDNISYFSEVVEMDKELEQRIEEAEKNLGLKLCDELLGLISQYEEKLNICKQKGISCSSLRYGDIDLLNERVDKIKKSAEYKEEVFQKIYDIDIYLERFQPTEETSVDQWDEFFSLCEQQISLIAESHKNNWSLPKLKYNDPADFEDMCRLHQRMFAVDLFLRDHRKNLTNGKEYHEYLEMCSKQMHNVALCTEKKWSEPRLMFSNLTWLYNQILKNEIHKKMYDLDSKINTLESRAQYNVEIINELIDTAKELREWLNNCNVYGWEVPKLKLDNPEQAIERYELYETMIKLDNAIADCLNDEVKENSSLLLTNCSLQNNNVQICLINSWKLPWLRVQDIDAVIAKVQKRKSWEGKKKKVKRFFATIAILAFLVFAVLIGGNIYFICTHAILPECLDGGIGKNYKEVFDDIDSTVFSNVHCEETLQGYYEPGTVVAINVDGQNVYSMDEYYRKDVEIIIYYSCSGRRNGKGYVEDWEELNYEVLKSRLNNAGFENVSLEEVCTTDRELDERIAAIYINDEKYESGECQITNDSSFRIQYYSCTKSIGLSYDECIGKNYSDIVLELENEGFTNIQLYRMNDLWVGWFNDEGAIYKMSIDDNETFYAGELYDFDAPIIIVVHTFSLWGCDDIKLEY